MTRRPVRPLVLFQHICTLYRDGFKQMTVGRTLWKLIFIKLFIMFAILKVFFFPNFLKANFDTDQERAEHVAKQLTRPAQSAMH